MSIVLSNSLLGYSQSKSEGKKSKEYIKTLKKVTDIMVIDATSPVAAARYYAYICLAANEVVNHYSKKYSLSHLLPSYTAPQSIPYQHLEYASSYALLYMGTELLPSGYQLKDTLRIWEDEIKKNNLNETDLAAIKTYVTQICRPVLSRANQDNFSILSSYRKYSPLNGSAYWKPTGPAFMQALEPHWAKIKPLVLDSARQFKPLPEAQYDTSRQSNFYQQMLEVYQTSINLSTQQKEIASFWDCNPFALQQIGHIEYAIKKISPGGHWIGITGIVCQNEQLDLAKTTWTHSLVAITLMDAFINCWAEKYSSNRIRPETAIKRLVDPKWIPFLQTPPFPEYTSGHSVISSACAEVLTTLFGDSYKFVDTTELEFELPPRKFSSFRNAAEEASISRLYGGIHFRDAITQGINQGKQIGQFIIQKLGVIK